ncbi:MAG: ComEC/Rec2 family competence protein [Pseudomonadota bacterium]
MLDRWRHATADALVAALPGPRGAFAAAILVGDRAAIDEADAEALRISSLAHLLAISGLHMGLLTGLVFAGCRLGLAVAGPVAMHWTAKKVAAAVALAAGAGYLGASGATVPTQRAFTMVAVALVAVMLDRPAITLRALALAAAIVLAIRPVSLVDPGFQMSFAATTALVAVYEALRARGRAAAGPAPSGRGSATAGRAGAGPPEAMSGGGGRPWIGLAGRLGRGGLRWAGAVALTSLVAGSATAPFAAAHFNRVAPWGLIANLAAVPVMGMWIAPAAAVAAVLAPLGLAAPALWLMGEGIGVVLAIAHGVAGLPGADGGVVSPPAGVLGAVALGGLWLAIWRGWWRLAGLALVVPALMAWHGAPPRPDLLVSPGGRLVGVMTPSGRALDHARADGYAARRWLDADGDRVAQAAAAARMGFAPPVDPEAPRRPAEVAAPLGAAGAGWQVVVQRGRRDAEGRAARACLPRIVLVAPAVDGPVDGGCATIGRAVLRAGGAVAVRIEAGEARLKTSRPAGGRPWRP